MANVRDSDTSLWLHNKLGNSTDLWSSGSICSQLSGDVLRNIRDCFTDSLTSLVKLKLVIALLHIPRRNVLEWKDELNEIIEIALADSDQWVSMCAELLKIFADDGTINFDIHENSSIFSDLVQELKKIVKKHGDSGILPIECLYLNKNALSSQIGQMPQLVKHFTLKRKPKSAALRAELLQKSMDASTSVRKGSIGTLATIRSKGLTLNDTPMKGIPSRPSFGSSLSFKPPNSVSRSAGSGRNPTRPSIPGVRRDGGIKFLDITEQPIGRDAKRKKKTHEENADITNKQKENDKSSDEKNATPDYAAGLTSAIPPSPAPSYALPQTTATTSTIQPIATLESSTKGPIENVQTEQASKAETNIMPGSTLQSPNKKNLSQVSSTESQPSNLQQFQGLAPNSSGVINSGPLQNRIIIEQPQIIEPVVPQQQQSETSRQPIQQQPKPQVLQTPPVLTLSPEQMAEAKQIFSNSNRVGKPEKALILSFMAGSRANPCPHLGDVVSIKLSEREETLKQQNGVLITLIAETHYQMNYKTGEGKQLKKYRQPQQLVQQQQQLLEIPKTQQMA